MRPSKHRSAKLSFERLRVQLAEANTTIAKYNFTRGVATGIVLGVVSSAEREDEVVCTGIAGVENEYYGVARSFSRSLEILPHHTNPHILQLRFSAAPVPYETR